MELKGSGSFGGAPVHLKELLRSDLQRAMKIARHGAPDLLEVLPYLGQSFYGGWIAFDADQRAVGIIMLRPVPDQESTAMITQLTLRDPHHSELGRQLVLRALQAMKIRSARFVVSSQPHVAEWFAHQAFVSRDHSSGMKFDLESFHSSMDLVREEFVQRPTLDFPPQRPTESRPFEVIFELRPSF